MTKINVPNFNVQKLDVPELKDQLLHQRKYFNSSETRSYEFRTQQLDKIENLILKNEHEICEALKKDLGKSYSEAFASEIAVTIEELRFIKKSLATWMKPEKVKTPLHLKPGKSFIYREPLGVVLILAPWNYPFQLAMAPLIGAIAAGNCAVIKPSEMASATSAIIAKLIGESFPADYIRVVEGGVPETTALLELAFDHIFFTGSGNVGKIVLAAAAKHLTPVTLELGGKSPVIVTQNANMDLAAKRIVWGKFLNSGQTCVAPDYLYVAASVQDELIEHMKKYIKAFFGDNIQKSPDYGRIISHKNFDRLEKMILPQQVVFGGRSDREDLYISPTVMKDVSWENAVMKEEIFGPLLPILTYQNIEEAYQAILENGKPLAAYLFSEDTSEHESFLNKIAFGGGCINDVILHLANPYLPFGGVGPSGMGNYHGEKSFQTFSHAKSVLKMTKFLDFSFRYPPSNDKKMYWIKKALRI